MISEEISFISFAAWLAEHLSVIKYNNNRTDGLVVADSPKMTEHYVRASLATVFKIPSLSLFGVQTANLAVENKPTLHSNHEQNPSSSNQALNFALSNLSSPVQYTLSHIHNARSLMPNNLQKSFAALIKANMSQFFKQNIEQKQNSDNVENVVNSKNIFQISAYEEITKNIIESLDVSTSFTVGNTVHSTENYSSYDPNIWLCSPMQLKVVINVIVCGVKTQLNLSVNGFIKGHYTEQNQGQLDEIDIKIDSTCLLTCLRNQARRVVLWAIYGDDKVILPYADTHKRKKCLKA